MSVVMNMPCPQCQKNGADKFGKYLMVFSDGGKLCVHTHNHDSRERYYVAPDGTDPVFDHAIDGKVQYSPEQFNQLVAEGKIANDFTRQLAMSGMRMKDRYAVMNDAEREAVEEEWRLDMDWFDTLKTKSLVDRGIHGLIAQLYDVRVGHDETGKVNRHYYPTHDVNTVAKMGAKARTLPKDFRSGHLGKRFDGTAMFGRHTTKRVMDSGTLKRGKMGKLLIVGGECDAMAAQQMLIKVNNRLESLQGLKNLDGLKLFHVWSPTKGETALQEIVDNREWIEQHEEIVWAFDDDDVGNKLNLACSRLFRSRSKFFNYPAGCKDANDCLNRGFDREFVAAWWEPVDAKVRGTLRSAAHWADAAKRVRTMGLSYFEPALNPITFGIQLSYMSVWGAGTGVGKTEITTQHICSLIKQGQPVVAIYLENSPDEVLQMVASQMANKDFTSPPWTEEEGTPYSVVRDYTQQQLDDTIDELVSSGLLFIPDLQGAKEISIIMEVLQDAIALGYAYFVIDNLTAFEHKVDDKVMTGTMAIDESMKRLGTFKDENPVNIMLLTHLTRPKDRTPHELGGEVYITDYRGAGSISFWANGAWAIERNTQASTISFKCTTLIRNLKARGNGHMVGSTVVIQKDMETGHYTLLNGVHELPEVGREKGGEEKKASRQVVNNLMADALSENQEF